MYCPTCGTIVNPDENNCSNCGININPKLFEFEPEHTRLYRAEKDIKQNIIWSILAYLGPLVIIPLFVGKNSNFAKYHCNQGLLLLIVFIVGASSLMIPNIGKFIGFTLLIIGAVYSVLGIMTAAKGEKKELPIIGKYKIIKIGE